MKLKARQYVDHPRYGPGTTLEDGGKRTMVYFRNVGIRKFPTCSGRVALMVGQARLTKRLPLKTQQGNFCGQIGDWRNSPAKCCDSINTSARHGSCGESTLRTGTSACSRRSDWRGRLKLYP